MWNRVFYTNWLIPAKSAGCARLMFVFIRPEYRDDRGLLEHELMHVRQFYRSPLTHGIRYRLSQRYRLACEVEAYREQMKHADRDLSGLFGLFISRDYGLDVSLGEAQRLLRQQPTGC